MLKTLKRKMMFFVMGIITAIMIGILLFTNTIPNMEMDQQAYNFLSNFTFKPTDPIPNDDRDLDRSNFVMRQDNLFNMSNMIQINLNDDNTISSWFCDRQDLYEDDFVENALKTITSSSNESGIFDSYYYLHKDNQILLLDNTMNFQTRHQTLIYSITACIMAWILLFFLTNYALNQMLKPVYTGIDKQRRFISDAGHELKTPIAVISTNASVLENEIGQNKWLTYIEKETSQMEYLVKELMNLAQLEENAQIEKTSFNLSKCVLKASLPFESMAFESMTTLDLNIEEDILFNGDENKFNQLVTIFLSNALKYGKEKGEIKVTLSSQNKKILLSIYNTGQGISDEEKSKIFERFYRVDKARSRSEGSHGLGLAIALAIVESYKGTIDVQSKENEWIQFNISFPKK